MAAIERSHAMRWLGWLLCGLVCVGGVLLLVYLAVPGLFGPFVWDRGYADYGYGWGWITPFGFPIMGLVMLVFCLLMIGGMLLRGQPHVHRGASSAPWQGESNLDILERRYSRGEITQEQFEEMKHALGL